MDYNAFHSPGCQPSPVSGQLYLQPLVVTCTSSWTLKHLQVYVIVLHLLTWNIQQRILRKLSPAEKCQDIAVTDPPRIILPETRINTTSFLSWFLCTSLAPFSQFFSMTPTLSHNIETKDTTGSPGTEPMSWQLAHAVFKRNETCHN